MTRIDVTTDRDTIRIWNREGTLLREISATDALNLIEADLGRKDGVLDPLAEDGPAMLNFHQDMKMPR